MTMTTLVFVEDAADELSQQALVMAQSRGPWAITPPGSERGNEILAHVAAKLDQPMAANCVSVTPGDPATVIRVRWGGSLLEEARLHGSPLLMTSAAHAVAAAPIGQVETVPVTASASELD